MKKKKQKTLRALKAEAWKWFSQYVRRRDADEGGTVSCYTCGQLMYWKEAHAGHAIPGRRNAVLYDLDIVKPQCPRDNIFLNGRHEVFATKLIKEHGMDWWEAKLAGAREVVKLTRADIEKLIEEMKNNVESLSV